MNAARFAIIILTGVALAACGGTLNTSSSSTSTSAPTTTSTSTSVPSTTTSIISTPTTSVAPTSTTTAVVNYGQQFLTDIAPWDTALAGIKSGDGLTSQAVVTAAREAVVSARNLLGQSWPTTAQGDVHTFAVALDTINEDVQEDDFPKFENDVTSLDADANVVRADLGLPSIK